MIECESPMHRPPETRFWPVRWLAAGVVVLLSSMLCHVPGAQADDNAGFSNANHLLFMTDQLANIQPPKKLVYTYTVTGGPENFSDHIDLELRDGDKQGKNIHVDFLSGKRHRYVPDISNAKGNPIIAVFLQHDVYTLAQRSGGSWRYFQKRIKLALQHAAKIEEGTANYHGKKIDTTRVSITPYAHMTSHQSAMGKALTEHYVFTLSDNVPGKVLTISSTIPGGKDAPDNVRKLALSSLEPLKPAKNSTAGSHNGTPAT